MKKNAKVNLWTRITAFVLVLMMAVTSMSVDCEAAKKKISQKTAEICVGETVKLKVEGVTDKVTWTSSDKKTASVSSAGTVTGKGEGTCKITATVGGKKYNCTVTVTPLPEDYATVNGKKVKVGDTVTLTYKMQCAKPIANIGTEYIFDCKALAFDRDWPDSKRWPTWECNVYDEEALDPETGKELPPFAQLTYLEDKGGYVDWADVNCKKAKKMEVLKMKVLKSGNHKIKLNIRGVSNAKGEAVKGYKLTVSIK